MTAPVTQLREPWRAGYGSMDVRCAMGMFDYLTCEVQLPVDTEGLGLFQTKFAEMPYMEHYVITKDGELLHSIEGEGDKTKIDFHGDLHFGGLHPITKKNYDFIARFTEGRLSRIWQVVDGE